MDAPPIGGFEVWFLSRFGGFAQVHRGGARLTVTLGSIHIMAELISYNDFKTLRLSRFYKPSFWYRSPIRTLDNWEFMGCLWVDEAVGFTEFLCLANKSTDLGSIAVDLIALPKKRLALYSKL